jgi:pyruvate dehydrogenase E2 component (dihydrolipoamide acetyltransferase)
MPQDIVLQMDGMLLNWLKSVGDAVKAGDLIAEFEADKATVEVEAPADGVLLAQHVAVGEEVSEGAVIAVVGAADEEAPPPPAAEPEETAPAPEPEPERPDPDADGRLRVSPVARRLAESKGIDLALVNGTGPDGRIVKADIENFDPARAKPKPAQPAAQSEPESAPAPAEAAEEASAQGASAGAPVVGAQTWGKLPQEDVVVHDISRMRQTIARGTILSKQQVPHFYVTNSVDTAALLALRAQINHDLEDQGIKVSVNDFIVKAVALALRKFPSLNTHYYGDRMVEHQRYNIGIAVALPDGGLVNVVSPDADKTTLAALAERHKALFARVRDGKIKPEDIRGATFTISNLGMYDVDHFSAIISTPEAAMLAVGASKAVPVVLEDGSLGVGQRMAMTISIDHRASDGATGAQFLQALKALLENPMRLLV